MVKKNKSESRKLNLKTTSFSKAKLLIFLALFGIVGGAILYKGFAAPNPNLQGDLNNDNVVSQADITILAANFNTTYSGADINTDGTVNFLDLSIILSHYGQTVPTTGEQKMVTPEGATITVAADVANWTPQQVYDILKPNAYQLSLIGPHLKIEVQTQYASSTVTGVSGTPANGYYNFDASIDLDARADRTFNTRPDDVIAHEYGHAWTLYHLYISQRGNWSPYLVERGLANDSRVESSYNWGKAEMIADDYRLLFGTATAQSQGAYINPAIPDPRTVTGLKDWFINTWAVP